MLHPSDNGPESSPEPSPSMVNLPLNGALGQIPPIWRPGRASDSPMGGGLPSSFYVS